MNDTENICREEFYWQFESAWVFGSFFFKESITDFCTYMLSRSCLFRMNNLHTPLEKSEIILKQNYTGTVWTWTFVIIQNTVNMWCLSNKALTVSSFVTWIVFKPGNGINVTSHHIKRRRKYEHHLCYHCISLAPGPQVKSDSKWI